jgi:CrcB protein
MRVDWRELAAVFAGGVLGALARAGLVEALPHGAILVANLVGTFALGLVGSNVVVGTGLIGAYTTFSTWMLETHRLAEDGRWRPAVLNVVGSLAVGLLAAWLGRQL